MKRAIPRDRAWDWKGFVRRSPINGTTGRNWFSDCVRGANRRERSLMSWARWTGKQELLGRRNRKCNAKWEIGFARWLHIVVFSQTGPLWRRIGTFLHRSDRMTKIYPNDRIVAYKKGSSLNDPLVHKKRALSWVGESKNCGDGCAFREVFYEGEAV